MLTWFWIQLLIDFGMLLIIWMVQLIIYPTFIQILDAKFIKWHAQYQKLISIFVLPLMIGQLLLHGYLLFKSLNYLTALAGALVLFTWITTFFHAVPLHQKLANNINRDMSCKKLVQVNWYRTIVWSLIFLISLYQLSVQ